MTRRRLAAAALAVVTIASGSWWLARPPLVRVVAGDDAQAALDAAPTGAVVTLGQGEHEGPLTVGRRLTLRGDPGAAVVVSGDEHAAILVTADRAVVEGIATYGGSSGIIVREVDGVRLESLHVTAADLHGVEVIDASARLSGVDVIGLRHPLAQGIEVRNADGRPDTVIADSSITGGMEGIVSHVAEVVIRDNVVQDTTMRGITVTEMSDGVVTGNRIEDATGAGLYCGDMSRCQFSDNIVTHVAGVDNGRSTEGWGLVVTYHAAASTTNDVLEGDAGATMASIGGKFLKRSPLEPGDGAGAIVPSLLAVLAALGVLGALYLTARPAARLLQRSVSPAGDRRGPTWLLSLGILGLAVQTFHMIEHSLQLYRVRVDGIPSRGGIVGPVVEAEWIHFSYNAAVLVGFLLVVVARKVGWQPPGRREIGDRILVAGLILQGYHTIEHSAKLAQHISSGAKVNHGILGGEIDLVLLHFSINLGVYLAAVGAAVAYMWGARLWRRFPQRGLSFG